MKILRVIASADPRGGGPIEGVFRSSAAMAELGHANELLTPDWSGDPWVRDCPLPIHAVGRSTDRYVFSPALTAWILRHADGYDAAIVHGLWNFTSVGAWLALRRRRTPYFVFPHGMLDPWFLKAQPLKGLAKRLYWRMLESKVLRGAERVLFTSDEELRLARRTFSGNWRDAVVGYGTTSPPEPSPAQAGALAGACPGLGGRPFLLFLSRIHQKKGCDLLVQAFADVADAWGELQLVMAGPDQVGWRRTLQARAADLGVADRIHWPGMLEGDAKWGAFRACEAFVLPSYQENFGIVVVEAMACRKPVLISKGVNIWSDIVAHGAGIAEPPDAAGVLSLLQRFLAMAPAQRQKMAEAAYDCFYRRFEIGRSARDILQCIEEARAGAPAAA